MDLETFISETLRQIIKGVLKFIPLGVGQEIFREAKGDCPWRQQVAQVNQGQSRDIPCETTIFPVSRVESANGEISIYNRGRSKREKYVRNTLGKVLALKATLKLSPNCPEIVAKEGI